MAFPNPDVPLRRHVGQTGQRVAVAASQTAAILGAAGAVGDYIAGLLVVPTTVDAGAIAVLDNAASTTVFAGGTASLDSLAPFFIPLGWKSINGAWKVTTGAGLSVIAVGEFSVAAALVERAGVTLVPLSLDANEIEEASAEDTVVGALQGKTTGSSLSLTGTAGNRFKLTGTNIVAGAVATAAGEYEVTVRETLAGASNTPNDTVLKITATEA
ncbi:hypothetical protein GIW81_00825 [Hyphomicrobium sp. xq]|uniref:Uncharacterized protein n=1 Tax=Hyphomicrobium album TaxID=2665159 RepID=A0A6I3KJA9_9HYPH|nr:hypothetical protein [Hyphomicrobium album]MTD92871.1 hypothetical protein [Hyphomicrobium album]